MIWLMSCVVATPSAQLEDDLVVALQAPCNRPLLGLEQCKIGYVTTLTVDSHPLEPDHAADDSVAMTRVRGLRHAYDLVATGPPIVPCSTGPNHQKLDEMWGTNLPERQATTESRKLAERALGSHRHLSALCAVRCQRQPAAGSLGDVCKSTSRPFSLDRPPDRRGAEVGHPG